MTNISPLLESFASSGASLLPYGPPEAGIDLVGSFGELDFEYAALRKACVIIDRPDRGTIEITGDDAVTFLQSMLTQDISGIPELGSAASFWLNKKGRIVADIRITKLPEKIILELDAFAVASVMETLGAYLIMEDAQLIDATDRVHRLSLHGPTAAMLIDAAGTRKLGPAASELTEGAVSICEVAGADALIVRTDSAGVPGFELSIPAEAAGAVYSKLIETGCIQDEPEPGSPASKIKLRPAGWHAYNAARIEAGTPLFRIDFSTDSLPAETSLLESRVSFTKGCYLGQEIVARMHNLGEPKQRLIAFKPAGESLRDDQGHPRQPLGGAEIFQAVGPAGEPFGKPIGTVTSSTISPMLGGEPICLAVVKGDFAEPGAELFVQAEGVVLSGTVNESLSFLG